MAVFSRFANFSISPYYNPKSLAMRLTRIITVITIITIVIIWSKRYSFSFAPCTAYADIVIISPNETNIVNI